MHEKSIFKAEKVVNSFYLPVSWWNYFTVKYIDVRKVVINPRTVDIQCGKVVISFYLPVSMVE